MKTLTLWLMRHGDASFDAPTDAERPLSEQGRSEVVAIANALKDRNLDLSFVWVSPYLRAQQTWELVRPALMAAQADQDHRSQGDDSSAPGVQSQVSPMFNLRLDAPITPGDDPKKVVEALANQTSGSGFLVAHQPLLGRLATYLETGEVQERSLGTASILVLEMDSVAPGCALMKRQLA